MNSKCDLFLSRCAAGMAHLGMYKYKAAAKSFLQVSIDHCDFPEVCKFYHEPVDFPDYLTNTCEIILRLSALLACRLKWITQVV